MSVFDRLTLAEDLLDCQGRVVARRGLVVSPESIEEAAQHARPAPRRALADTPLGGDLEVALDDPAYRALFARAGARDAVARAVAAAGLTERLVEELLALRAERPALHLHAFTTAAVAVRMLLSAVGGARALPDLAAAALLHDLGMRHVPATVVERADRLEIREAHRIAAHPLLGAFQLARELGPHPAVAAARCHHWRCGQGYPGMGAAPSRAVEVVSVASAFAALTRPRAYRSAAYDARGAADVIVAEVLAGHADANTAKLLVHALRGGRGDPRAIRFGGAREGHAPEVNRHAPVAAPGRSPL
ncbi:putative metal dependent phosphohydrolase [Anaeromyxobacter sp. K]|nr:putative metal dependent phosphohydrolase [Anaeromyxobacter sp. K]